MPLKLQNVLKCVSLDYLQRKTTNSEVNEKNKDFLCDYHIELVLLNTYFLNYRIKL